MTTPFLITSEEENSVASLVFDNEHGSGLIDCDQGSWTTYIETADGRCLAAFEDVVGPCPSNYRGWYFIRKVARPIRKFDLRIPPFPVDLEVTRGYHRMTRNKAKKNKAS
jgi:hypothetical protein